MKKISIVTLNSFLLFSILLNSSCTIYYETSKIDSEISNSVQTANKNCNQLVGEINDLEKEYRSLNCVSRNDPFNSALVYITEIDKSKMEMQGLLNIVNNEYGNFKVYSKGKVNIASNTSEWKQFKQTKKILKSNFKEIQIIGKKTVKKAEDFNRFVNEKIVPMVTMIDVASYIKSYHESKMTFENTQKDLEQKMTSLEQQIMNLQPKISKDKHNLLKNDFNEMKAFAKELDLVQAKLNQTISLFKNQTKGITKIYSCSVEWEIINATEKSFDEQEDAFDTIHAKIMDAFNHMQSVIQQP